MSSFQAIPDLFARQPADLGPKLARIDRGSGREDLFSEQLPQVLDALAEATRVASIQASTAIEGYDVSDRRADQIARTPGGRFRNRNEKEFAGYRDAIDAMVRGTNGLEPLKLSYILYIDRELHRYTHGGGGRLKQDENQIVAFDNDGRRRVIFKPVAPEHTKSAMRNLLLGYNDGLAKAAAHPLLLLGLLVLDFLAIHPIPDGNGRVSRLLTVHELLRLGYGIPRYVSVEQLILESKNTYYDVLEASQAGWHEANHDPWPWLVYFVSIIGEAYEIFEQKLAAARNVGHGSKGDRARQQILNEAGNEFRLADVQKALPGISMATIRNAANKLRDEGVFTVDRGANAVWRRVG